MRALYQRQKGRDLFDFWYANKEIKGIDFTEVIRIFMIYMEKGKTPVTYKQYKENIDLKRSNKVFNNDIIPLLSPEIAKYYDLNEAYDLLFTLIVPSFKTVES